MQNKNTQNANIILDRLKILFNLSTDLKLSEFLGVKANTISSWRNRNTLDYALIIAKCNNIDLNHIFTSSQIVDKKLSGELSGELSGSLENNNPIKSTLNNVKEPINKNVMKGCERCEANQELINELKEDKDYLKNEINDLKTNKLNLQQELKDMRVQNRELHDRIKTLENLIIHNSNQPAETGQKKKSA